MFFKIGGSYLTDKQNKKRLFEDRIQKIAQAIRLARAECEFELVLAHGAGSFGHIIAKQLNAQQGAHPEHGWKAYYQIRQDMVDMNNCLLVLKIHQKLKYR